MIKLENVSKTFKNGDSTDSQALKNISLEISNGTPTAITGPSGSGKTTLLSMVGCINRPTSGRIWFGRTELTHLTERFLCRIRREKFGFIFQDFNLIPGLTVLENVMLPAYSAVVSNGEIKSRARTLLRDLSLESSRNTSVEKLSGGEKKRTAIARALINKPEILLADEPTAHLDSKLAEDFLEIINWLSKMGKTVLVSTHDARVYRSQAIGTIYELRDGYLNGEAMNA